MICGDWIQNVGLGYTRSSMGVTIYVKRISTSGDYGDRFAIINLDVRGKIYLDQKIGIGYRKWKGNGGDGSYVEIEMGTISARRLPDFHVCVEEAPEVPYVEPEPKPEEPTMTCQNSSTIEAGEIWTTYYANIRVIDVYDTNSGKIGIKPLGKTETTYNVTEGQVINTETADFNITVKPYSIFAGSDGTKIMQFTLCWEPKVAPPTMCTQTFKLQDQNGNPINGNVQIGTTNVTVLGTGTVSLEQGKAYTAVASFSDMPTQTKTFTACTTTTFVFEVPTTGSLSCYSVPTGAEILINDISYGITNKENIELSPDVYNVVLKKEGYDDVTKEVTIQLGIPGIISVDLIPIYVPPVLTNYIGNITYDALADLIGEDEITFTIPVTNVDTVPRWFYVEAFIGDEKIAKEPDLIYKTMLAGLTEDIIITSKGAIYPTAWSLETVRGKDVRFELRSSTNGLLGFDVIDTKIVSVEADIEPPTEPPVEPPVEPDVCTQEFNVFNLNGSPLNDAVISVDGKTGVTDVNGKTSISELIIGKIYKYDVLIVTTLFESVEGALGGGATIVWSDNFTGCSISPVVVNLLEDYTSLDPEGPTPPPEEPELPGMCFQEFHIKKGGKYVKGLIHVTGNGTDHIVDTSVLHAMTLATGLTYTAVATYEEKEITKTFKACTKEAIVFDFDDNLLLYAAVFIAAYIMFGGMG